MAIVHRLEDLKVQELSQNLCECSLWDSKARGSEYRMEAQLILQPQLSCHSRRRRSSGDSETRGRVRAGTNLKYLDGTCA